LQAQRDELARLREENKRLRAENEKLRQSVGKPPSGMGDGEGSKPKPEPLRTALVGEWKQPGADDVRIFTTRGEFRQLTRNPFTGNMFLGGRYRFIDDDLVELSTTLGTPFPITTTFQVQIKGDTLTLTPVRPIPGP